MRRARWVILASVLSLFLVPSVGQAQVPPRQGRPAADWDQLLERIRPIFLKRLGEELALDKATLDKMAQSFDQFRRESQALRKQRRALARKLREALARGASEEELEAILREFEAYQDRRHKLTRDRLAKVREILGTRRFAQYVLFRHKFRQEIRRMLLEKRRKRLKHKG
jgi:Skp family chaperone for outer membrane proteins